MKDNFFGREYDIAPAGGETGQAFVATHEDEKFFLKRNSSPFLAALSVENIVPKLVGRDGWKMAMLLLPKNGLIAIF